MLSPLQASTLSPPASIFRVLAAPLPRCNVYAKGQRCITHTPFVMCCSSLVTSLPSWRMALWVTMARERKEAAVHRHSPAGWLTGIFICRACFSSSPNLAFCFHRCARATTSSNFCVGADDPLPCPRRPSPRRWPSVCACVCVFDRRTKRTLPSPTHTSCAREGGPCTVVQCL